MLSLPLAENAMKHGPGAGHRGDVDLRVVIEGDDGERVGSRTRARSPARARAASGLPVSSDACALAYAGRGDVPHPGTGDRTLAEVRFPRHPRDEGRA